MHEFKKRVARALEHAGWTSVDMLSLESTTSIAIRTFESIVGTKTAYLYLVKSDAGPDQYRILGEYHSEGRNILSPLSIATSEEKTDAELHQLACEVNSAVLTPIHESYAMRLARP
jgi:hypothetical protein